MTKRLTGRNPLSYLGVEPYSPPDATMHLFDPTDTDAQNFNIGDIWINNATPGSEKVWMLVNLDGGVATWVLFVGGVGDLISLTGNSGGKVFGDGSHNINVVGDVATVNIVGNPGAHSLTASVGGTVATTYDCDTGSAIPAGNVLNVVGTSPIETDGSGDTITIFSDGTVATSYTCNIGTATPVAGGLVVVGDSNHIITTGSGHTIVISAVGSGEIETLTGDSGGPVGPAAGNVNTVGGTGIVIAGNPGTNTLTTSVTGIVPTSFKGDTGTAIPAANILHIVGDGATATTTAAGSTITISAVGAGEVSTLTGNSGGAVSPTLGNINVKGDVTSIVITGNPGTSTLTAAVSGAVPLVFDADTGSAVPAINELNIVGGTAISTTASGSTVTINNTGVRLLTGNTGGPVSPLAGNIDIVGDGTTIDIVGTPLTNTLTASTTGAVAVSYVCDTGSAAPSGGVLTVHGAGGLTTSGAGSTVTITGPGFATGTFTPVMNFGGVSTGITYATRNGKYTAVGNLVTYAASINFTSKGGNTGNATVTGLPIAPVSVTNVAQDGGFSAAGGVTLDAGFTWGHSAVSSAGGGTVLLFEDASPGPTPGNAALTDTNFANNSTFTIIGSYWTS